MAAQATPAQMEFVRAELAKRGLTEFEVRDRLKQNGIDIDQIPVNQLPQYRERIVGILDKLLAEKRAVGDTIMGFLTPPVDSGVRPLTAPADSADSTALRRRKRPVRQPGDLPWIYGHDIFIDQTVDFFRTTEGVRAPDSHVLDTGDQLLVSIFGTSQVDLFLEVGPDGSVQPTGVPKIYLRGLTLGQARTLLRSRLAGYYRFNADQYTLTLQTVRTVMVNVFGETELRGSFSVSALNTALHALSAAGGPTSIGSVREIQVVRGTQRRKLDVYAFLDDPKVLFDFDLQHNDVVFVPVAKTIVTVEGAVRRPMRYELVDGEDLTHLLRYAGGVNFNANPDQIQVTRVAGDSVLLKDFRMRDVLEGKVKVPLQDGDVIRVRTIGRPMEQIVEVEGAVFYEGRYDLTAGRTLGQVLARAQPKQDAASVAYVTRSDANNRENVSYIRLDLIEDQGFQLEPMDKVSIYSRSVFTEIGELSVSGAVQRGTVRVTYDPGLTVRDLITMAGGFTLNSALNRVDLFRLRVDPTKGTTFDRIELSVDSSYSVVRGPQNLRLQPFDQVIVREIPLFAVERNVQLSGQVLFPGTYALSNTVTHLSDVIREAGGLTALADPQFAVLTREGVGQIGVDLQRALKEVRAEQADPILHPGDIIQVDRRQNTVRIRLRGTRVGEFAVIPNRLAMASTPPTSAAPVPVPVPAEAAPAGAGRANASQSATEASAVQIDTTTSSFIYQGPHSARWYIQEFAGGFAQEADRWSVTVTDPSGRVRGTSRAFLFFRSYPTVTPGSTVTLRTKFEKPKEAVATTKVDWNAILTRTTQLISTIVTLVIVTQRL